MKIRRGAAAAAAVVLALSVTSRRPMPPRRLAERAAAGTASNRPTTEAGPRARGGRRSPTTATMSEAEQAAIEAQTDAISSQGQRRRAPPTTVPVYIHVMTATTAPATSPSSRSRDQIAVLNKTFAGGESPDAANTGFRFALAGTDRFYNDNWHTDKPSNSTAR